MISNLVRRVYDTAWTGRIHLQPLYFYVWKEQRTPSKFLSILLISSFFDALCIYLSIGVEDFHRGRILGKA